MARLKPKLRVLPKAEKATHMLSHARRSLQDVSLRQKLRDDFTDNDLLDMIDVNDIDTLYDFDALNPYAQQASRLRGARINLKSYPTKKDKTVLYSVFDAPLDIPSRTTRTPLRRRTKDAPQSDYKRIANTKNPRKQLLDRIDSISDYDTFQDFDSTHINPASIKFRIKKGKYE